VHELTRIFSQVNCVIVRHRQFVEVVGRARTNAAHHKRPISKSQFVMQQHFLSSSQKNFLN